jgi:hypothetical protein
MGWTCSLTTTAIYADALGTEERSIAARLWEQRAYTNISTL